MLEGTYQLKVRSTRKFGTYCISVLMPENGLVYLPLCELVLSIPFSNGRVEQIFLSLKVIKTSNRTSLQTSTLDNLLEISIEGPPLSSCSTDSAIDLWWSDCHTTRGTNQTKRKPYRPRSSTLTTTSLTSTTGGESQELDDLTLDSRDCSESDSSSEETALSSILED